MAALGLLGFVEAAAGQHDVRAGAVTSQGGFVANSGVGAGDEHRFAGQVRHLLRGPHSISELGSR